MLLSTSGSTVNSLVKYYHENEKNPYGILLSDPSEYKTFQKFIQKYLKLSQNFDINEFDHIHKPDEHKNFLQINTAYSEKILITTVVLIRNIIDLPFVTSKNNENSKVEEIIHKSLDNLNIKSPIGKYLPMTSDEAVNLSANIFSSSEIDDGKKFGVQSDFPANRGIIVFTEKENIHAIVNDIDHIKFHLKSTDDKLHTHFINILRTFK